MADILSVSNFTTTDGLSISIAQYTNHTLYSVKDQAADTYKATIRHDSKSFNVQLHFEYPNMEQDRYITYDNNERFKNHLGTIRASKYVSNPDEGEIEVMTAIRKVARLCPPHITSINDIHNTLYQIKLSTDPTQIPYLLTLIQTNLDYLKLKFK
jgi:hypothetical protein